MNHPTFTTADEAIDWYLDQIAANVKGDWHCGIDKWAIPGRNGMKIEELRDADGNCPLCALAKAVKPDAEWNKADIVAYWSALDRAGLPYDSAAADFPEDEEDLSLRHASVAAKDIARAADWKNYGGNIQRIRDRLVAILHPTPTNIGEDA